MGDTERFLLGTVILGVLASELRDLPNLVAQKKRGGAVARAVQIRWAGMVILILASVWYVRQRQLQGAK